MYGRQRKGITYMTCDYGRVYGAVAADQIDGHGKWLSIREDALLPLVEDFFAQRIFGPMRTDKLARQLRAHDKTARKQTAAAHRHLRDTIADLDRRIGLQIQALEQGIEPELVGERIADLRAAKEKADIELRALSPVDIDQNGSEDPGALLERIPDLTALLRHSPPAVKRQLFDAFGLRLSYDKPGNRLEITATVTQQLADALQNTDVAQTTSQLHNRPAAHITATLSP